MPELTEKIILQHTTAGQQPTIKIFNSELLDFCLTHHVNKAPLLPYYTADDIAFHIRDYQEKGFVYKTGLFRLYTILNTNKLAIGEYLRKLDKDNQDNNDQDKGMSEQNRDTTFLVLLTKREFLEMKIEEKEKETVQELKSSGSLIYVDDFEEVFK